MKKHEHRLIQIARKCGGVFRNQPILEVKCSICEHKEYQLEPQEKTSEVEPPLRAM